MIERIKEIARQAGFELTPGTNMYKFEKFCNALVLQCGYHADIFSTLGCPKDMDAIDTKPSDYIKNSMMQDPEMNLSFESWREKYIYKHRQVPSSGWNDPNQCWYYEWMEYCKELQTNQKEKLK